MPDSFSPGQAITVYVHKADGSVYRWWRSTVESVDEESIAIVSPANSILYQSASWFQHTEVTRPRASRTLFFPGRRHTILEVYNPDGSLHELYADICSPIACAGDELHYTDYELDVSKVGSAEARLVDEDEFEEAALRFGYSEEFKRLCYATAKEVLELISGWTPRGMVPPLAEQALPPAEPDEQIENGRGAPEQSSSE